MRDKTTPPVNMLVDYARYYHACEEIGLPDPLDTLVRCAKGRGVTHMYVWGFSVGSGISSLRRHLEAVTSFKVSLSEVPLSSLAHETPVAGRVVASGTRDAIFMLRDNNKEVSFDMHLGYTAGVLSTGPAPDDGGLPSFIFVSNASSLLACAANLDTSCDLSAAFAFPTHVLGGYFCREKRRVFPRVKVINIEDYSKNNPGVTHQDSIFEGLE